MIKPLSNMFAWLKSRKASIKHPNRSRRGLFTPEIAKPHNWQAKESRRAVQNCDRQYVKPIKFGGRYKVEKEFRFRKNRSIYARLTNGQIIRVSRR